jgi:hypothetical protein
MLHLYPQADPQARPPAYAEAVSRLASVRHALRLVDTGFSDGPGSDQDIAVAAAWDEAGEAKQRWFDKSAERLVGTAAAGIEALIGQRHDGREPHPAASQTLVEQIRRELREVAGIVLS